jgi:hypothetical protein
LSRLRGRVRHAQENRAEEGRRWSTPGACPPNTIFPISRNFLTKRFLGAAVALAVAEAARFLCYYLMFIFSFRYFSAEPQRLPATTSYI